MSTVAITPLANRHSQVCCDHSWPFLLGIYLWAPFAKIHTYAQMRDWHTGKEQKNWNSSRKPTTPIRHNITKMGMAKPIKRVLVDHTYITKWRADGQITRYWNMTYGHTAYNHRAPTDLHSWKSCRLLNTDKSTETFNWLTDRYHSQTIRQVSRYRQAK